jgi:lipopolysaccharide/colanic/teichoic acid biosynthesis glycosyltransferase
MDSAQSGSIASLEPKDSNKVSLGGGPGDRMRAKAVKATENGPLSGGVNGTAGTVALRPPAAPGRAPAEILRAPAHGALAKATKRTIDLIGAVLLIAILSPLLVVIALLIKMDSPGPILFRQRRIGRADEPFSMLKFRTMVDGADTLKPTLFELNESDGFFKIADDPRVTKVGKFLRQTYLDELPQLINVLRGEMSLVGPRPLVPDEDVRIEGWQRNRLLLKPGMTGHWQIFGASRVPMREMVKIDYLYGANWSLWLDAKILLRTVPYVVRRSGQ